MVETPASGPAITWAYGYDWLDRLTSLTKDSVLQSVYSYDESDNRIQLQMPVPGQTHSYAYDFADRILSRSVGGSVVETFSHDADGNMIARTTAGVTTTYNWNDDNRLISISKPCLNAGYRYDSEGIRKSKGSDTRYFSSGAASLADLHPTNSISYVQGHQILGMIQAGAFYWYISDALSTVRLVVDGTGAVVASYASDEFGNQTAATGSADLRQHTYSGGLGVRNDADSGLYCARQRYYDPSVGRWLNADPIGFEGGLSLLAYVGNNPTNFVDPEGLQLENPSAVWWSTAVQTAFSLQTAGQVFWSTVEAYLTLEGIRAVAPNPFHLEQAAMRQSASSMFRGGRQGLTNAGRALVKHPNIAEALEVILRNGTRTQKYNGPHKLDSPLS
jgi:RHS repeat-associated protein